MEKINKKALIISLLLALVCAVVVYQYIIKNTGVEVKAETHEILVAARELKPGDKIIDADIMSQQVPLEVKKMPGISNKKDIVGMYVKERILVGEQFTTERLAEIGDMSLSHNIPPNKRAMSIFVDQEALLSSLLKVGDYIDVIVSFDKYEELNDYRKSTQTILQNLEVLAIGSERIIVDDKKITDKLPKTITLCVTLQQAEELKYARDYGLVSFVLRAQGDSSNINTPGVIRSDVMPAKADMGIATE